MLSARIREEVHEARLECGTRAHLPEEERPASIRAERKLGVILRDTPKATGAAGIGKEQSAVPDEYRTQPPTLADLGIDKKTSARAQKLADLPDETFEAVR